MKTPITLTNLIQNQIFVSKFYKINLTTVFLNFVFCINFYSQSFDCDPIDYQVDNETTLCNTYSNFTPTTTLGIGINSASQVTGDLTGNILIAGDFVVDRTFKFYNAVIKISPGKKIKVQPIHLLPDIGFGDQYGRRVKFTIDNSDLFSCSGTWLGIEMTTQTDIVVRNGTHIEDAEKAINAINTNSVTLNITSTWFNRNKNGIFLSNNNFFIYDPVFRGFNDNSFTCTSSINGFSSTYSETGIYLQNIAGNISTSSPNSPSVTYFENQVDGILLKGGSTFLRANYLEFNTCWSSGVKLEENASLKIDHSNFTSIYESGIDGKSVRNLTIYDCHFHLNYVQFEFPVNSIGVLLESNSNKSSVNIQKSSFSTDQPVPADRIEKGIVIMGSEIGSQNNVQIYNENIFDFSGHKGVCIELDGTFPTSFNCDITNNSFTLFNPATNNVKILAINCINGDKNNISIIGNSFQGNGQRCTAIDFSGSTTHHLGTGCDISNNHFQGSFPSMGDGVKVSYFYDLKLCQNIDYFSSYAPFNFQNINLGTILTANTIYGGATSIFLPSKGAIMDIQKHKGNLFIPVAINSGIFSVWYNPRPYRIALTDPDLNTIYVHTKQSEWNNGWTYLSYYHPKFIIPNDNKWFKTDETGTPETTCAVQSPPSTADSIDLLIANNLISNIISDSIIQLGPKWYLYSKLKNEPTYAGLSSAFSQYLAINNNNLIGKLFNIEQLIQKAVNIS